MNLSSKEGERKESEVTQSCSTLCNAMDCSLPGSSIPGIFQARVLEWVAIAFSRMEPESPTLQVDSLPSEPPGKPIGHTTYGFLSKKFPPLSLLPHYHLFSQLAFPKASFYFIFLKPGVHLEQST